MKRWILELLRGTLLGAWFGFLLVAPRLGTWTRDFYTEPQFRRAWAFMDVPLWAQPVSLALAFLVLIWFGLWSAEQLRRTSGLNRVLGLLMAAQVLLVPGFWLLDRSLKLLNLRETEMIFIAQAVVLILLALLACQMSLALLRRQWGAVPVSVVLVAELACVGALPLAKHDFVLTDLSLLYGFAFAGFQATLLIQTLARTRLLFTFFVVAGGVLAFARFQAGPAFESLPVGLGGPEPSRQVLWQDAYYPTTLHPRSDCAVLGSQRDELLHWYCESPLTRAVGLEALEHRARLDWDPAAVWEGRLLHLERGDDGYAQALPILQPNQALSGPAVIARYGFYRQAPPQKTLHGQLSLDGKAWAGARVALFHHNPYSEPDFRLEEWCAVQTTSAEGEFTFYDVRGNARLAIEIPSDKKLKLLDPRPELYLMTLDGPEEAGTFHVETER